VAVPAGVHRGNEELKRRSGVIQPRLQRNRSNPETGWNDCVFGYHDNAVADKVVV
jgi:hypothetical protein